MEIKPLTFLKKKIEIRETYIDIDGKTKERIKMVEVPTGICTEDENKNSVEEERK